MPSPIPFVRAPDPLDALLAHAASLIGRAESVAFALEELGGASDRNHRAIDRQLFGNRSINFSSRRSRRASRRLTSASFVSSGALSTKWRRHRTSAATC